VDLPQIAPILNHDKSKDIDDGKMDKIEYANEIIKMCYKAEDIIYAQYKFRDGFLDNNKDFYDFDYFCEDTPGEG